MSTSFHPFPSTTREENVLWQTTADAEHSPASADVLSRFVAHLENDASLIEFDRVRERLNALDRLDAYLPCMIETGAAWIDPKIVLRAQAIRDRLGSINARFYEEIRHRIQHGLRPCFPLPSLIEENLNAPCDGLGYDFVDEVITGVFQFEEPQGDSSSRDPERLFYQPTPARHIFRLIDLAALSASDVFVDLGSGLGHVPMIVSICTAAHSFGIEIERAYVECASECAQRLNLSRVTFMQGDVLEADLSLGTVFYLYTPFMGSVLRAVLDRLRQEASTRPIRIFSHGPCTPIVAAEPWLRATNTPDSDSITVLWSHG
jgi:histone methylation protein DOT1